MSWFVVVLQTSVFMQYIERFHMKRYRMFDLVTSAAVILGLSSSAAFAGFRATTDFENPALWSVGDAHTTYQEWDNFLALTGNAPGVGMNVNPSIPSGPFVDVVSPGFVSGTANFYAFSGDYAVSADIYNHGGSAGTGLIGGGVGTYVIVQTSSTLNGSDGVYSNTLEIVDLLGGPIVGGGNADSRRHDVLFEGTVSSSFGDVTLREEIWEFYLPDYEGDFKVQGDIIVHASFDRLRVDSAIIPDPTGLVGDLNRDGFVGIDDLNLVLGNWNQAVPPADARADPSGDNFVGIDDLNAVLGNWNTGAPPTVSVIPEPTALGMIVLGGGMMLAARRR